METGSGELIATDESTIVSKLGLDAIVVEDGERDRRLSNPACTDEGDWFEAFCKFDDLLDYIVTSNADPEGRGRGFS